MLQGCQHVRNSCALLNETALRETPQRTWCQIPLWPVFVRFHNDAEPSKRRCLTQSYLRRSNRRVVLFLPTLGGLRAELPQCSLAQRLCPPIQALVHVDAWTSKQLTLQFVRDENASGNLTLESVDIPETRIPYVDLTGCVPPFHSARP